MHTFSEEFRDALSMIELGEKRTDRAVEAHEEVRVALEADETLKSWGLQTRLIGSYGRSTAIHPGRDVDVFAMLPDAPDDVSPDEVHEAIKKPLQARYEGRVTEGRRSVTVDFPDDDFAVDVVGAVPSDDRWKTPQADAEEKRTSWQETDPLRLGDLTTEQNEAAQVIDDRHAYVPTVKLIRQIRKHHLHERKPAGLYFEFEANWAFVAGVQGDSWVEVLTETLERIAGQLESGQLITDPAMEAAYSPAPNVEDLDHAKEVFRGLADDARGALHEDEECPAAATWRRILGENERSWVFVYPDGCDEEGQKTKSIAAVRDRGPREASPFA